MSDILIGNISGNLTLPSYPSLYPNFFDYTARIQAEEKTRILVTFHWVDTEYQRFCLYDYVQLRTFEDDRPWNICGIVKDRKDFASYSNQALLRFHSDHSISGKGFSASWQVISVSDCDLDINHPSGFINSVNYPRFYLNMLDCTSIIRASAGARIFLDFVYFDVGIKTDHSSLSCHDTDYVSVYLDDEHGSRYVRLCGKLNTVNTAGVSKGLIYVSYGNVIKVSFHSDSKDWGIGYRAKYDSCKYDIKN